MRACLFAVLVALAGCGDSTTIINNPSASSAKAAGSGSGGSDGSGGEGGAPGTTVSSSTTSASSADASSSSASTADVATSTASTGAGGAGGEAPAPVVDRECSVEPSLSEGCPANYNFTFACGSGDKPSTDCTPNGSVEGWTVWCCAEDCFPNGDVGCDGVQALACHEGPSGCSLSDEFGNYCCPDWEG